MVFHGKFMMINAMDIQQAWKNMAAFIHGTPRADGANAVWTPVTRIAGERNMTDSRYPGISPFLGNCVVFRRRHGTRRERNLSLSRYGKEESNMDENIPIKKYFAKILCEVLCGSCFLTAGEKNGCI